MRTRYVIGVHDGVGIRAVTREGVRTRLRNRTDDSADLSGDLTKVRLYANQDVAWRDFYAGRFQFSFSVIRILLEG